MLRIIKIINHPVSSNCYVIFDERYNTCLIVDPGTEDCDVLINYLQNNGLTPDYLLLTHEHVDHIIGCEKLRELFDAKIVCSANCALAMQSSKLNLTRMTDQWEERFSMPMADILIEDVNYLLFWSGYNIRFFKAEGHSKGSIFISCGDNLFVGDTLIKGYKTICNLPGASKEHLILTFESLLSNFDPLKTLVFPGHFDSFYLVEVRREIIDQIERLKATLQRKGLIN